MREFVAGIVQKNSSGELVPLSKDPSLDEVRRHWPGQADKPLVGDLRLTSFTHLNLLYVCRNSLVHELREPGYGMEFHDGHAEPFYHGTTAIETDGSATQTLELVYPLGFYFALTQRVLDNMEPYLRRSQIDPYSCYRFGSSFMRELNR